MQKVVDQITDNLNGLITEDLPAYSPKDLLKAGIPSFIVERIRVITEDLLLAEIHKPDSMWANFDNELVSYAWQDFIDSIYGSSHVPKDYLYSTISIVVEEVMEVLLEPRHKMADYLYRNHEMLSFDELSKRCNRLTIYKHIGVAIPMYMKKRGLEELSYERCHKLIVALDEKLVANYTAKDWADKLDVLFIIFGGKVSPDIFATFFLDKDLNRAVRYFNELEEPLNRAEFIEFMTAKGTNDLVGDEKDKEFVDDKFNKSDVDEESPAKEDLVNDYFGEYSDDEPTIVKQYTIDNDISEKEMLAILRDIEGKSSEVDKESLNALFLEEDKGKEIVKKTKKQTSREPSDDDMKAFRHNLISVLDEARDSYKNLTNDPKEEAPVKKKSEEKKKVKEEPIEEIVEEESFQELDDLIQSKDDSEEEEPMWAQFLSKDQMQVMMGKREQEATEENTEGSILVEDEDDEFIIEEAPLTSDLKSLQDHLKSKKAEWIKVLFNGKQKDYNTTVKEIEKQKDWKQASEYVQLHVFNKEDVDMSSEEAIAFIDELQIFFKEHKS